MKRIQSLAISYIQKYCLEVCKVFAGTDPRVEIKGYPIKSGPRESIEAGHRETIKAGPTERIKTDPRVTITRHPIEPGYKPYRTDPTGPRERIQTDPSV